MLGEAIDWIWGAPGVFRIQKCCLADARCAQRRDWWNTLGTLVDRFVQETVIDRAPKGARREEMMPGEGAASSSSRFPAAQMQRLSTGLSASKNLEVLPKRLQSTFQADVRV